MIVATGMNDIQASFVETVVSVVVSVLSVNPASFIVIVSVRVSKSELILLFAVYDVNISSSSLSVANPTK